MAPPNTMRPMGGLLPGRLLPGETIRQAPSVRSSARLEAERAEQHGGPGVRVVRVALDTDELDRRRLLVEEPAVVLVDVAALAVPVAHVARARADHDQHPLEQLELVRAGLGTGGGSRVPHVLDALHALEHDHHTPGLIVPLGIAYV